jgi:hypothetical protein
VPVLYATDRRRTSDSSYRASFSSDRTLNDDLQYGRATVTIPRDHRPGRLESPSWLHLEFRQNPAKHVMLMKSEPLDAQAFYRDLSASATGKERAMWTGVSRTSSSF